VQKTVIQYISTTIDTTSKNMTASTFNMETYHYERISSVYTSV